MLTVLMYIWYVCVCVCVYIWLGNVLPYSMGKEGKKDQGIFHNI